MTRNGDIKKCVLVEGVSDMGIILGGPKFLATFVCAFSNNFAATQAFNFEQVREGGRPKSGDVVLVKSQVLKSVYEAKKNSSCSNIEI